MSKRACPTSLRLVLASAVALGASIADSRPAAAQASYAVEDLGALAGDSGSVAWAINANGDVAGWSIGPGGTRAFVYTNARGIVALPSLPNRPRTLARDINDVGDVVGVASAAGTDLGHAVLWSGDSVQDIGTLGTGSFSEAWGINNRGQIVGTSSTAGGGLGAHGFLYTDGGGLRDLTPESDSGAATDINDAGQIVGYKTAPGGSHAFRWDSGAFADLGVIPGFASSFGWAIGATGQVAGSSTSASANSERLVRYTDGSGLQNLGGVGEHNAAFGINGRGDVVGCSGQSAKRALRYTDQDGLRDLNALIDPSLGWILLCAHDVNDAGQIAAYASNSQTGLTHAVRLQPMPTAPPECTLGCLRATGIELQGKRRAIKGQVTIQDENGLSMAHALVVARWTRPDGSSQDANARTHANGTARFAAKGPYGLYTLTIVNVVLSQHTFNPSRSVLSRSITTVR